MSWTPEEEAAWQAAIDEGAATANTKRVSDLPSVNGHLKPDLPSTWLPVDLAPVVAGIQAGEIVGPIPQLMPRSDGPCLLYPGEVHSLAGEPETGKGFIALAAASVVIAAGAHVLYLDFEDAPASIVGRLLALGAQPDAIVARFAYVRPSDPFVGATLDLLLNRQRYELAILDGLSEAYALLDLDPYSNLDAATFLAKLARPIAATGAAVLLIDHVVKAKDNRGRYALGAQHKLAGIAVAYSTDAITVPSRTTPGKIKIKVEKDRHGHVRSHADAGLIALAHVTPEDGGQRVTVTLDPPEVTYAPDGTRRLTNIMEKVSRLIENEPGIGVVGIRNGINSQAKHVDQAVHTLLAEGYVDRREDGQKKRHYSLRPYRQDDDPTTLSDHV